MNPSRQPVTLHARGRVDGVSEQTVPRHLGPHNSRHHRPSVDTHADLKQERGRLRLTNKITPQTEPREINLYGHCMRQSLKARANFVKPPVIINCNGRQITGYCTDCDRLRGEVAQWIRTHQAQTFAVIVLSHPGYNVIVVLLQSLFKVLIFCYIAVQSCHKNMINRF